MHKPDKSILRIRYYREAKGYSQDYMAEMLGVSQSTYANLESGKTSLNIDRLLRIAEILETDFPKLLEYQTKITGKGNRLNKSSVPTAEPVHQETKEVYQELIYELRNEIDFLRSLIRPAN